MLLCALGFLENVSEVLLTVKFKQLSVGKEGPVKELVVGLEFDEVSVKKGNIHKQCSISLLILEAHSPLFVYL